MPSKTRPSYPMGQIMDDYRVQAGARLKVVQRASGLTQNDLAAVLGITRHTVSALCRGEQGMAIKYLVPLAVALKVSPAYLAAASEQEAKLANRVPCEITEAALLQHAGASCRAARISAKISIVSLADEIGIHRTYLSFFENAKRPISLPLMAALASKLRSALYQWLETRVSNPGR